MASQLKISVGQYSDPGRKEVNQDFYGASQPTGYALASKGLALAIADGISSSQSAAECIPEQSLTVALISIL